MRSNMLFSGEIYTTGKNFTLPPAVTNITSGSNDPFFKSHMDFHRKLNEYCRIENKQTNWIADRWTNLKWPEGKQQNSSERPIDALAVTDSVSDNLKSRDASASNKQIETWKPWTRLLVQTMTKLPKLDFQVERPPLLVLSRKLQCKIVMN